MMTVPRIFITGDTHGLKDFKHVVDIQIYWEQDLNEKDVIIICGDAGLTWYNDGCKNLKFILPYSRMNCQIVVIDGNHENFHMLEQYPKTTKFGGPVYQLSSSVFYLNRGYVYNINGQKFFVFGGGNSYDIIVRNTYLNWWPEERPTLKQFKQGHKSLDKHNWTVDYIVTHTCGLSDLDILEDELDKCFRKDRENPEYDLNLYIDDLKHRCTYKKHFFGHFHEDIVIDRKTNALFQSYYELTEYPKI